MGKPPLEDALRRAGHHAAAASSAALEARLHARFTEACLRTQQHTTNTSTPGSCDAAPPALHPWAPRCWSCLVAAYAEPHRHYHTLAHLDAMFDWLDRAESADGLAAVTWAVFFHDAVYAAKVWRLATPTYSPGEATRGGRGG